MRKQLMALLAVLAIATTVFGCGEEDGGEESLATSSLSKAEYVERVDEICARDRRRTAKQLEAYVAQAGSAPSEEPKERLAAAIEAIFLPSLEAKIEEIRALGAPSGGEEQVKAFLAATEQAIDEARSKTTTSLAEFGQELKPAGEIAHDYGFRACS